MANNYNQPKWPKRSKEQHIQVQTQVFWIFFFDLQTYLEFLRLIKPQKTLNLACFEAIFVTSQNLQLFFLDFSALWRSIVGWNTTPFRSTNLCRRKNLALKMYICSIIGGLKKFLSKGLECFFHLQTSDSFESCETSLVFSSSVPTSAFGNRSSWKRQKNFFDESSK